MVIPPIAQYDINIWLKKNWLLLTIMFGFVLLVWETSARAESMRHEINALTVRAKKIDIIYEKVIRIEQILVDLKEGG